MKNTSRLLSAALTLALGFLTHQAKADKLSDCGDIHVEAEAECEVKAEGGCTIEDCSSISCSASLYAECEGGCDAELPSCEAECQGSCEAECEVKPGDFECSASCQGSCEGNCSADCKGHCEAEDNQAECEANCSATCEATCQGECDASCEGTPVEAECSGKCEGSCKGSCNGRARLECQLECHAEGKAKCKTDCEVECEKPEGALFCDGQYVDHGGHLDSCVGALKSKLDIEVNGYAEAEGEASCKNGKCEAEGSAKAGASCSMMRGSGRQPIEAIAIALAGLAGVGLLRRRRARKSR